MRIALRRLRKDETENHQEGLSFQPAQAFVERPYCKLMDLLVREATGIDVIVAASPSGRVSC